MSPVLLMGDLCGKGPPEGAVNEKFRGVTVFLRSKFGIYQDGAHVRGRFPANKNIFEGALPS